MTRAAAAALVLIATNHMAATTASAAAHVECSSEVIGGTIDADVLVPTGAVCHLSGVHVAGDVAVQGALSMGGGSVGGNLATSGGQVHLVGVDLGANISIDRPGASGTPFAGPSFMLCISSVAGNIAVTRGTAGHTTSVSPSACGASTVIPNVVGGTLAFLNHQAGHSTFVQTATVGGNLACTGAGSFLAIGATVEGTTFNTCPGP